MANLVLRNIKKSYPNGYEAVRGIDLTIDDKEGVVLIGPQGCGKTTLLRIVSGLEKPDQGEMFMDGQQMLDREPRDRNIAMLFQNYALYKSETVYNNLAAGLKLRKVPDEELDMCVRKTAFIMGIDRILYRKARSLDEDKRVRLALGRAIVFQPDVILVDNLFRKLPKKQEEKWVRELFELQQEIGITMIYAAQTLPMQVKNTKKIYISEGKVERIET